MQSPLGRYDRYLYTVQTWPAFFYELFIVFHCCNREICSRPLPAVERVNMHKTYFRCPVSLISSHVLTMPAKLMEKKNCLRLNSIFSITTEIAVWCWDQRYLLVLFLKNENKPSWEQQQVPRSRLKVRPDHPDFPTQSNVCVGRGRETRGPFVSAAVPPYFYARIPPCRNPLPPPPLPPTPPARPPPRPLRLGKMDIRSDVSRCEYRSLSAP